VDMRILVEMVNSSRVKRTGSPDDTVNFVPFGQKEIRQVRAILAGDSGDKCLFHRTLLPASGVATFVAGNNSSIFFARGSAFNVWRSTFNVQRLMFGVWRFVTFLAPWLGVQLIQAVEILLLFYF
jgi:hypothetical protein